MKKVDYAYLAGILDGEGCVRIRKRKNADETVYFGSVISVEMTTEYIPTLFQFAFGGSINRVGRGENNKDSFVWTLTGKQALDCLKTLYPYLILKKPNADILIKTFKDIPKGYHLNSMERAIAEANAKAIKVLNKRGK